MGRTNSEMALLKVIRAIPKGRVVTYSALAKLTENEIPVAEVSRVMKRISKSSHMPWWRVVRKDGKNGVLQGTEGGEQQRQRLEAEGVKFQGENIPLKAYEWEP